MERGLFACSPVLPTLAVDLRVLELVKKLFVQLTPNMTAWCEALKSFLEGQGYCHDCDRTYPYTPYPNLSMPIPSHLNHSRAPNAKPEPSDPLASQQCTPEHSDSLASSQRTPDPTHLRPFLSLTSSRSPTPTPIPDPTLIRPLLFLASSRFLSRIDQFSLGPIEDGSKRGRDGSRGAGVLARGTRSCT